MLMSACDGKEKVICMGYIDQFVASVSFNTKKVIEFRKQNAWKTILYILVFVIVTGGINIFLTWESSLELFKEAWIASGSDIADQDGMMLAHAMTQYIMVFLDLIVHFILISAVAYAGSKGYQTVGRISYREAWNTTAYGITAPILVRLVAQGMAFEFQMMLFAYWGAVMIFSMLCSKRIVNLPPDDLVSESS